MDGKAPQLGPKRLLNMLGIGGIEFVLFRKPAMRPLSGLILTADRVQFAEHDVAEVGRCCNVETDGIKKLPLGTVAVVDHKFLSPHEWRSGSEFGRLAVQPAIVSARPPFTS